MSKHSRAEELGRVRRVRIGDVDTGSSLFRITAGDATAGLIKSISEWGCISPPICIERETKLVPVAGFKRLDALAGILDPDQQIEVRELPAETGTLRILSVAAADTLCHRPLNPFEIARAVKVGLSLGHTRATMAKHLLPHLGVEPHEKVVERHLKLLRIQPAIATFLEGKGVTLKRALELVRVPSEGAPVLVELASTLGLSARALEEWARMIGDIAQRDLCSWSEMAKTSGLQEIARDADLTASDRARRCSRLLRKLRYPLWAQALATTRARIEKLDAPERVTVKWDDTFESEGLTLEIRVHDTGGFQDDVARLTAPDRLDRLADLLDSL